MDDLLDRIAAAVGPQGLLAGEALAGRSGGYGGRALEALALVRPASTDEVAAVLKLCNEAGRPVVAQGGLTGLADAQHTGPGDVALSLERMAAVEAVDPAGRTLTVQAGASLETVQRAAGDAGLFFPLDLGARGSCTIGGNIATNAGGNRVIRYGMMRELVLGLEAVLADGTVVSSMSPFLKNNTGYDLKQLFLGSEGTLGIVTRAILRLYERPASTGTAFLAAPGFGQVIGLLKLFDRALGGTLTSFEVLWRDMYQLNAVEAASGPPPVPPEWPYYVLVESMGADAETDSARLEAALERAFADGLAADGVLAASEKERARLWEIREGSEAAWAALGGEVTFDVSLPITDMEAYIDTVRSAVAEAVPAARMVVFGHAGDGNLHLVFGGVADDMAAIEAAVYRPLAAVRGSVSAEHGIGLEKKAWLGVSRSDAEIGVMRAVKRALDPNGIMNPGKIFDL